MTPINLIGIVFIIIASIIIYYDRKARGMLDEQKNKK